MGRNLMGVIVKDHNLMYFPPVCQKSRQSLREGSILVQHSHSREKVLNIGFGWGMGKSSASHELE